MMMMMMMTMITMVIMDITKYPFLWRWMRENVSLESTESFLWKEGTLYR